MGLTEKDKRVIACAARLLVERMIDDPESLPAAEIQASAMVRSLQKSYGDTVIRMALEKAMNKMLEARKPTNKKKVNEMGRLSTIHANGAEGREKMAAKVATAKTRRAAVWTEDDVRYTLRDIVDDFACDMYQQIKAFVDEVNGDSKIPIFPYKERANEYISKKGFLFLVGFTDSEERGHPGSFDAGYGIGYPTHLISGNEVCVVTCDDKGSLSNASEIADFLSGAGGQPVQVCYFVNPNNKLEKLRFFFEFENYEPMAKAGVWDDILDKKTNPNVGDVIGTITGKGAYNIEGITQQSAMVSTDDLFHCLEQDDVFADWLMTGNWDPRFDTESDEYLDDDFDDIDESVADFSSKHMYRKK